MEVAVCVEFAWERVGAMCSFDVIVSAFDAHESGGEPYYFKAGRTRVQASDVASDRLDVNFHREGSFDGCSVLLVRLE